MFRDRDPRAFEVTTVELLEQSTDGSWLPQEYVLMESSFWEREVMNCAVNQRGWVFQEWLLSPRVLHFGRHQVLWECRDQDACEMYPEGIPAGLDLFLDKLKILEQESENDAYRLWYSYVETYSQAALTVPGDKLVALSGVAKRFMTRTNDVYLAGM